MNYDYYLMDKEMEGQTLKSVWSLLYFRLPEDILRAFWPVSEIPPFHDPNRLTRWSKYSLSASGRTPLESAAWGEALSCHLKTFTCRELLKQVILISALFFTVTGELESKWDAFFSFLSSREQTSLEFQRMDISCPQGEMISSLFLEI